MNREFGMGDGADDNDNTRPDVHTDADPVFQSGWFNCLKANPWLQRVAAVTEAPGLLVLLETSKDPSDLSEG